MGGQSAQLNAPLPHVKRLEGIQWGEAHVPLKLGSVSKKSTARSQESWWQFAILSRFE